MRELLVINPNRSASVSDLLRRHIEAEAGPEVDVRVAGARFGALYITDEVSYSVAAHAALDAWSNALLPPQPQPAAVLIGCFGDPGLRALRTNSMAPVMGLAEASFIEAARHGNFAIVTGGDKWKPILQRFAHATGFAASLTGIHTVAPSGAELAADPAAAHALLAQACRDAVRESGARAVIVGGAGLAGYAAALQPEMGLPLIDSVKAGARWARRVLGLDARP
jgi:allantoin racemase